MKKIFLLLSLVFVFLCVQASQYDCYMTDNDTILMYEDFESGAIPEGWVATNSLVFQWVVAHYIDFYHNPGCYFPHEGYYALWHCGFEQDEISDDYLTTTPIDLTDYTSATLSFWFINPAWNGHYNRLFVQVEGNTVFSYASDLTEWTYAEISLDEYCGRSINLVFDFFDGYGFYTIIDEVKVTANQPTAVSERDATNVKVYPNPTQGDLHLEAEGMTRVTVTSMLGQTILDEAVDAENVTIELGDVKAGIYLLRVYSENGVTTRKISVRQ